MSRPATASAAPRRPDAKAAPASSRFGVGFATMRRAWSPASPRRPEESHRFVVFLDRVRARRFNFCAKQILTNFAPFFKQDSRRRADQDDDERRARPRIQRRANQQTRSRSVRRRQQRRADHQQTRSRSIRRRQQSKIKRSSMGRSKKGTKSSLDSGASSSSVPAAWNSGPWCVLGQNERSISLLECLKESGNDIMRVAPPPGEKPSVQEVTGSLVDRAKYLFYRLIGMVFRELEDGRYFQELTFANLVVTADGLVKIRKNVLRATESTQLLEENVHALGNLINDLTTAASPRYAQDPTVNPELCHLLGLLRRYTKGSSTYQIKFHSGNVPDCNRGFYYVITYDHTKDVLRFVDPVVFEFVVNGVEIPATWHPNMSTNTVLAGFLARGNYDHTASNKKTVPALVPLKCLRHCPSHAMEHAPEPTNEDGVGYTRGDLSRMLYHRTPMALCTMAQCLDTAGELAKLGLDHLFPGTPGIPE